MVTEGRQHQTIEGLRIDLQKIFEGHPGSHLNDAGETVIPADALVDVFSSLSDSLSDEPLMSGEEVAMFEALLKHNPGLEVTPQIILNFIEEKTKINPPRSPGNSDDDAAAPEKYRDHSRSSSNESNGATFYPESSSRPPSRGSHTPAPMTSPLDSQRRQRSTPLAAPSSWSTKRPAPLRRKSDAGSRSDSDSHSSTFGRSTSRSRMRGPSNPTSPSLSYRDLGVFSPGSPPSGATISRPHSRAQSQPQNSFANSHFDHGYSSPDDNNHTLRRSRNQFGYDYNDSFESSAAMPRTSNSDSDDEDEIDAGLVLDRHNASSTISLELHDRLDALQRNNEELSRKLLEAEKNLQDKLATYDLELDEAQHKLEELRSELNASNREEKELRTKDAKNQNTITSYELELGNVTKSLEQSRATYLSLQKQYQEQCALSEKYRDDLRQREETIRSLRDAASVHEAEAVKWLREREMYEERIGLLERELEVLSIAQSQLDEQKQQNLMLKETIDRVRYEMDEMRNSAPTNIAGSGLSSAANTISKSLGAELMGKMKFDMDLDEELQEGETTIEDDDKTEVEDDEEEDVVQTIITKRKRKVASRASVIETRRTFEEVKEYSDGATQYDPTLFAVNHSMQTDPPPKIMKSSFSIQTETPPEPKPLPLPPPRITIEMEIQTEEVEEEPSRSPSPQINDESMASSSSTIVPPTPKPQTKALDHEQADEPPSYNQIADRDEREWRVAAETLKKWHNGVKIPFEPIAGGVSDETVEDWKALKQELGIECMVIDKIVASSERAVTSGPSTPRLPKEQKARRSGRFYNIYNTYVYGDSNNNKSTLTSGGFTFGFAGQAVALMGASALVLMAAAPYLAPSYSIPGGATYYDRSAWNSFNTMQAAGEGFGPDGTAAVWNFLGRVGGGAARIARGWPT